jgi:hypothetical protein
MRNLRKIVLIVILLTLGLLSYAKKIGSFTDEYFKFPILRVDDRRIYIFDKMLCKGVIYDRKSLKKIAEFGNRGDGPFEFRGISGASIDDNYIYVSSFPKLYIFSKEGKPIKEYRVPMKTGGFFPLGNGTYLATQNVSSRPGDITIKVDYLVFDSNLKLKKTFYTPEFHCFFRYDNGKQIIYEPRDCVEAAVYKNNIYCGNTANGFYFAVFNRDGNKLYEIKLNVPKETISSAEKKQMIALRSKTSEVTMGDMSFKAEYVISDEVPAYKYFFVCDDRIYAFTYIHNKVGFVYILDLKGNLIKKKEIRLEGDMLIMRLVNSQMSCMDKGKLLTVVDSLEDPDSDPELHEFEIFN